MVCIIVEIAGTRIRLVSANKLYLMNHITYCHAIQFQRLKFAFLLGILFLPFFLK